MTPGAGGGCVACGNTDKASFLDLTFKKGGLSWKVHSNLATRELLPIVRDGDTTIKIFFLFLRGGGMGGRGECLLGNAMTIKF